MDYWTRLRADGALCLRTDASPADPAAAITSILFLDGDVITQIGAGADAALRARHGEALARAVRTMRTSARRWALGVETTLVTVSGIGALLAWLWGLERVDIDQLWGLVAVPAAGSALHTMLRGATRLIIRRLIGAEAGFD